MKANHKGMQYKSCILWAEILKTAKEEDKNTISITWGIDDVIEHGKTLGKRVSQKKASQILQDVKHNHDCNYGITWETFTCYF